MAGRARRVALTAAIAGAVLVVVALVAARYFENGNPASEVARLASEVGIQPGMTVAEIGAGSGRMTVEMARVVGTGGRVIATELGAAQQAAIREAARRAGLANVAVVAAGEHETNLPAGCCDAVYMHWVYHHLTDPAGVIASARQALKPGGRLALMEFEPNWIRNWSTPHGVPERGGHGVPREMLVREMRRYGFVLRGEMEDWPDWGYLAVFTASSAQGISRPRGTRPAFPMLAAAVLPF